MLHTFFLVIASIIISNFYHNVLDEKAFGHYETLGSVAIGILTIYVVGFILCRVLTRQIQIVGEENARHRRLRLAYRAVTLYNLLLLVVYSIIIFVVRYGIYLEESCGLKNNPFLLQIGLFTPFIAMLAVSWLALFPFERFVRGNTWKLGEYFRFKLIGVLPIIPVLLLNLLAALLTYLPEDWQIALNTTWIGLLLFAAMFFLIFATIPIFIRILFPCRTLEPGWQRERLEAMAKRAGVGFRDILIWETGGGRIPNAMVTGIIPFIRYVFITDELFNSFPVEEIEAVFGHELGHAKHRHLWYYFFLSFGMLFVGVVLFFIFTLLHISLHSILALALFAGSYLLFFCYLSRYFERQADLFGARLCGNSFAFIAALEHLCEISGRSRSTPSWIHYSIEERVDFLLGLENNMAMEQRYQRRVGAVKLGFILSIVVLGMISLSFWKSSNLYDNIDQNYLAQESPFVEAELKEMSDLSLKLNPYQVTNHLVNGEFELFRGDFDNCIDHFATAAHLSMSKDDIHKIQIEINRLELFADHNLPATKKCNEAKLFLQGAYETAKARINAKGVK